MTRHKSLATAMSALLAYRDRPEGDPVPVTTNWALTPSNDNSELSDLEGFGVERGLRTRPTIQRIIMQVAANDIERNNDGQIVRIGDLRFSDGSKFENGFKLGPGGEVVVTQLRMPTGAMLGASEEMERTISGTDNPVEVTASNNYFSDMFAVQLRRRIPQRKREKRVGKSYTHAEAKAMLAEAYASTPDLPPVTKCPPGLPSAGGKIADSFLGMKKAANGESGSMGWQDISTALVDREIWAQAIAELSEHDKRALDFVASGRAKNMAELGVHLGMQYEYARRKGGKRALEAANDNLQATLKKISA